MGKTVKKTVRNSVLLGAAITVAIFSLSATAVQDQAIPDDSLGLSKTSVLDVPDPAVFEYDEAAPGTVGKRALRSYNTAPPMIPHTTQDMVPIRLDANLCKDCHAQPDLIGTKITVGIPVPMPVSHYSNVKAGEVYMGRWNCTQCHRPQANVKNLVTNTFKKAR